MNDRELVSIIEAEIAMSVGRFNGQLAAEQKMELDYYNGQPFGNEKEGESQVVSTDVFDAVEGVLPVLLKTFTASDDAVVFEPNGPEDEAQAAQRTEVCNYVFYRQNNGFLVMYEWFKDALINKNGIVKYWWEKKTDVSKEDYQGLTEGEFLMLQQDPDVEIISEESYEDPQASEQKMTMLQAMPPENPMRAQLEAMPVPLLHNVSLKRSKDASQICIATVPPEEFGISQRQTTVSIQDTAFCYQRTRMTISALREQGCPEEVIEQIGGDSEQDNSPISLARDRFVDQTWRPAAEPDPSMREVWVVDGFIRTDFDGDGVAELRHFIMPGKAIWINEETDHINFAAITPIIQPHRFTGRSLAEIVMDIQFTSSTLWRQMLNNLYLTNNPRKAVLSNASGTVQANLDDLLNSRPGGIVREYVPNAVRDLEVPFVAGASFPMLEHMQGIKENRTGLTRYNQGTDADSLNKTASGISMIQSAAQNRIDLIARIFAETGVKDLFRGIAYFLSKYSSKAMTLRLRNKWVDIDPREWKNQYDMTVNVGLGTGNKDMQLVHLAKMGEVQIQLMKEGRGYMVTDDNVYNLGRKMAENMGFKHPELFISDPKSVQKPQPQPDPALIKIQAETQVDQAKLQDNKLIRQFDAQTQKELEAMRLQSQRDIAELNARTQLQIEQMREQHAAQLAVFGQRTDPADPDFERWKAELDARTKLAVAELGAQTTITTSQIQAAKSGVTMQFDAKDQLADVAGSIKTIAETKMQDANNAAQALTVAVGELSGAAQAVKTIAESFATTAQSLAAATTKPRKGTFNGKPFEIV